MDRRSFVRLAAGAATLAATGAPTLAPRALGAPVGYGPLGPPDANGVRLPDGFSSRVIARAGVAVTGTGYEWHLFPDGGATFPTDDGGWVYVSNSETAVIGGTGAVRFDSSGAIVDAYRILSGTTANCSGGATPWGTWLSCEEHERGQVWECDPLGDDDAVVRPALGRFTHEAAAVDPRDGRVYLTEDRSDSLLYRFTPASGRAGPGALAAGRLEAARVDGSEVTWLTVPAPASGLPLRHQVSGATTFARGEGAAFAGGKVFFTTTSDNRLWSYDPATARLRVVHDGRAVAGSPLGGADNVAAGPDNAVYVSEDGGDLQVVAIARDGSASPVLQVTGSPHDGSEITGPAFDPSGTRLYFSSQRGFGDGITYEVTGPFRQVAPATTTTAAAAPTSADGSPTVGNPAGVESDDGGDEARWVAGTAVGALLVIGAGAWRLRNRATPAG